MQSPAKNYQEPPRATENITLLLLSPHDDDVTALRNVFHHPGWRVERRHSLSEGLTELGKVPVVLTERDLPDGSWKDVLEVLTSEQKGGALIVISRYADELLWAEVLNLGGYDVLQKPFETNEVLRVVSMAWRQGKSRIPA